MPSPLVKSINWEEIFVAYVNGCPLEELCQVYNVELLTLKQYETTHNWPKLRASIPQNVAVTPLEKTNAKLALIQQNRETNLKGWAKLRDQLFEVIDEMRAGKLRIEKAFHNRGSIVVHEAQPGPGDLVNIATALRTVSDGTYRALGDFQASDKGGQDGPANSQGQPPAITIILPGVIAAPRDRRTTDVSSAERGASQLRSTVIDLNDAKTPTTAALPIPKGQQPPPQDS